LSRSRSRRNAAALAGLALLLAFPDTAHAQAAHAAAAPQPAPAADKPGLEDPALGALEHAPRHPNDLVTLSLENADLPELVRVMSEMTGKRFIIGAAPKSFQATIVSPQKVTVAEAYQAFLTVLAANHLTVVPRGRFLKIIDAQDAVRQAPISRGSDASPQPADERYVTYVHRVAHVAADDVANGVLSKLASHDGAVIAYGGVLLLTDTEASVHRMMRVLDELDVAQAEDKVWLEPLQFVPAADVKKELDELLDTKGAAGKAVAAVGGAADARVTKVVALDKPNALLVVGSPSGYERLLELVRAIDVSTPSEGQIHVVMLEHADAKKIVGAISEAVAAAGAAVPAGAAATARVLDAPVKVSAEETNNALIVTATAHDFAAVREVIRRLDQPRRQVYIEAVVMDLSVQRTTQLETALHGFGDLSGALGAGSVAYGGSNAQTSLRGSPTDTTALQALVLGVRGPSIAVPEFLQSTLGTSSIPGLGFFLDAYAITQDADVLSTPHILATDNIPADIKVKLNTSLQRNAASFSLPASGAAGAAASSLLPVSAPATQNYQAIGPEIKVTPHLNDSDDVRLDVSETISDVTSGPQGTLGTIDFLERAATTTLTVKDGHTAVIGGLVRDKVTHRTVKVPLLGDIPVLGALFRSKLDDIDKGNLVLVLTPHIIRTEDDMRRVFEERMQERQEFLDHYMVFRDGPPVGFHPARGHGMLFEVRASDREIEERRRFAPPPPEATPAHEPRAPIDLPSARAAIAGPNAPALNVLNVQAPPRSIERVEH
jgi:general secretion pathway protein D